MPFLDDCQAIALFLLRGRPGVLTLALKHMQSHLFLDLCKQLHFDHDLIVECAVSHELLLGGGAAVLAHILSGDEVPIVPESLVTRLPILLSRLELLT